MTIQKVLKDIEPVVMAALADVRKDADAHLQTKTDPADSRRILIDLVPKLVSSEGSLTLDTFLGNLEQDCYQALSDASVDVRNEFLGADKSMLRHVFQPDYGILAMSPDPRAARGKQCAATLGGGGFLVTALLYLALRGTPWGWLLWGTGLVATPILAYKAYEKGLSDAIPDARAQLRDDVERYLEHARVQMMYAFEKVGQEYGKWFYDFCAGHGVTTKA